MVAIFILLLLLAALLGDLPLLILILYLIVSLVTFLLYACDKRAAQRQGWRIAESTLHGCSLLGGWPGALLAQKKFRHKTRKEPFQGLFRLTVLLNLSALLWLCSKSGALFLSSILSLLPFSGVWLLR